MQEQIISARYLDKAKLMKFLKERFAPQEYSVTVCSLQGSQATSSSRILLLSNTAWLLLERLGGGKGGEKIQTPG